VLRSGEQNWPKKTELVRTPPASPLRRSGASLNARVRKLGETNAKPAPINAAATNKARADAVRVSNRNPRAITP
jgi:hypothetical protein